MTSYFVTGTDTNVGKTFVTCLLARLAVTAGHKVFAFKPIETGCVAGATGQLVGSDQRALCEAAGGWQTDRLAGLYQFAFPAAPLVAAEAVGATIDIASVVQVARSGPSQGASFTLVEGAGGWRVPITRESDISRLARALAWPVIVVARAGLGTINHTLLTIEAVEHDGVPIAAVVLSHRPDDDLAFTDSNRAEVLRRWDGTVLVARDDEPQALAGLVPRLS